MPSFVRVSVVFLLLALAPAAHATEVCRAFGIANDYNAFVFGDFKAQSSDVEGRLAAGGKVDINNYSLADKLTASTAGTSVVIGGDFVFPSGRLYYGNAKVGGNAAGVGSAVRNGLASGQTITDRTTLPFSFASEQARLTALSATIAGLTANATYESKWGGLYLKGKAGASLQVFDLPGQLVLDAHTFDVTGIPSGATVVFNIRGATAGLTNMSLESLASIRRRVLFNFPDATKLELAGISVEGAILAPKADIANPQGVIKGTLIAKSWNGMMQLNHEPFEGCVSATPANRAPVATAQSVTTNEDAAKAITLAGTDADGDALTYDIVTQPTKGTLSGTGANRTYTPNANYNGADSLTFKVTDSKGAASSAATVSITVSPVNDAPTATAQSVATNEDTAKSITLTGSDVDGTTPTFIVVTQPTNGTLSGAAPNLTYTPNANYNGADSFTFKAKDASSESPAATVSITVTPINDAPVAQAQSVRTDRNAPKTITLTGTDIDGDTLTYRIAMQPQHGAVAISGATATYTPTTGYTGADHFTFVAKDATTESVAATVDILIEGTNRAPVAVPQTVRTGRDQPWSITLTGTDADGDALTYRIATPPQHGEVTLSGAIATYTPALDYIGDDGFTFTVEDATDTSAPATIAITVDANRIPVAEPTHVATKPDTARTFPLIAYDFDGDIITYHVAVEPLHGRVELGEGTATYTPDAGYTGADRFTYVVRDASAESSPAIVDITIDATNHAPVAIGERYDALQGDATTAWLQGTDLDGDAITFQLVSQPAHGSVELDGEQAVFTPDPAFVGTDSFDFVAVDAHGAQSAPATITIDFSANQPPLAQPTHVEVARNSSVRFMLDGSDPEGSNVTARIVTAPEHGSIEFIDERRVRYEADGGYSGPDSFTFVVNDGAHDSEPATVTLTVGPNHAPSVSPYDVSIAEDTSIRLTPGGVDEDNDRLTFTLVQQPQHGTLTVTDSEWIYAPAANYHGIERFAYKANDGDLDSEPADIVVRVRSVNDAPVALPQDLATERDVALDIVLTASDVDGESFTQWEIVSNPSGGVLNGAGPNRTFAPHPGFSGDTTFTFRVADDQSLWSTAPATVTIHVRATNRAPIAKAQDVVVDEDTAVSFVLDASDPDGGTLAYMIDTAPQHGTLSGTAPDLTYTPVANYHGTDHFTYTIDDGEFDASATVTIDVAAVNDRPTAAGQSIEVERGIAKTIMLVGTDVDGDALTYRVIDQPQHGTVVLDGARATYTSNARYTGADRFTFVANDGTFDSTAATITIDVTSQNGAPTITSTPVTSVDEDAAYRYDLDATDPNGDTLTYSSEQLPNGLGVGLQSGIVDGMPTNLPTQSVQDLNTQCYLVPEGARAVGGNGSQTYRPALQQRIVDAIERGSAYMVPQTFAWENAQTERCLGCHVQTQAVSGLQAATRKADVDVVASDRLLDDLIAAQQPDGSILRNDPRHHVVQTAVALWALDEGRNRAHTLETRRRALDYLYTERRETNVGFGVLMTWRNSLDMTGWFGATNDYALPGIIAKAASRYIDDVDGDPAATAEQRATAEQYRSAMPLIARAISPFMAQTVVGNNVTHALQVYGVMYARRHIADAAQLSAIDTMVAKSDALLRARQRADGGWSLVGDGSNSGDFSDPVATAWVGHALQAAGAPADDADILRLITHLLVSQQPDGSWTADIRSFTTPLGGTSLVVAYLPTALEHFGNADLTVGHAAIVPTEDAFLLTAQVRNRGLADATKPIVVRFFQDNVLLGETTIARLDSDHAATASIEVASVPHSNVRITAESTSTIECDTTNNDATAGVASVRVQDPDDLFDTQQWLLNIDDVNAAPMFTSTPITRLEQGRAYTYQLTVSDEDRGDAAHFELIDGPDGLHLDGHDGKFYYDVETLTAGTHTVHVRAIDLRGATADQTFTLTVLPNGAPTITSTPVLDAVVDSTYRYTVTATDPDGDALIYTLRESSLTMRIDAITGVITWTPQVSHVGTQPVTVVVSDGRGMEATQTFTITVATSDGNHAPVFTSTAVTTATSGSVYTYAVEAIDADNDPITLTLASKPVGMTLNEATGVITWRPTFAQVGTHQVQIKADDYKRGVTYQTYGITVSAPAQNVAPLIDSTPRTYGKVGREYRYDVIASDGNGDALSYSVTGSPSGMTVDAAGKLRWTPTASGRHSATVRVSDGSLHTDQTWTIDVLAEDVALAANVEITPQPVLPGATLRITVDITGAAAPTTLTGTLDGDTLTLSPTGTTQVTAPTTPGEHTVVVTVTDGHDTSSTTETFTVGDADTTDPAVTIDAPTEGAQEEILTVTAPTDVVASINDDNLEGWSLTLRERGAPSNEIIELARGTNAVTAAQIGTIDPTRLQNGLWVLVLDAWDAAGNTGQATLPISIEGDMKPGHYSVSFNDLTVPVAGIPITVTRTYDTRQRHKKLDFGYGWNVDYQSVRLQEARTPGFGWQVTVTNSGPMGGVPETCVRSALGNVVSVTMPDGKVEKFRAKAEPECTNEQRLDYALVFAPMDGTHGTLKALDDATGRAQGGNLTDIDGTRLLNPNRYVYTSAEGQEFQLDQGFTVREIHEPVSDQTVTFGHDGVIHSAGPSILFVRDAHDRITKIIAPDGSELTYEYAPVNGDLAAFIDAEGNRTEYTYTARLPHYLEDIIDPRGVRVSRNEYDDDGRLVAVVDADNNRIEYSRDIDGRVETVKDRRGHSTTYVYNDRGDVIAETNAEGETTERGYDAYGNQLWEKDPLGREKAWTHDAAGNVLTETNGAGETTTNVYGPYNQLVTVKDAANRIVMSNFYRNRTVAGVVIAPGPLMGMTDANSLSTTFTYDPMTGEVASIKDPTGAESWMEYDAQGHRTADVDALGHRTTYVNDAMGRPLSQTTTDVDASGTTITLTTLFEYDANGNVIKTIAPDGSFSATEYDGNGKPVKECANDRCTTTEYDDRGNVVKVTQPDGTFTTTTFDENGNTLTSTDALGKTTRYVYDKANRLIETILPDDDANEANNPRQQNVYDEAGQLIESIDANGNRTTYAYDDAGRRTHTTLPPVGAAMAATFITEYDDTGRRTASTDADGDRTEYRYDAGGRLIETIFDDGESTMTEYDNAGRKTADIDPMNRRTEYRYDTLGRLTHVILAAGTPSATVTTYTYDARGNKLTQTDAEGRTTRWEYDVMGREIARILPNTERETKAYNLRGELESSTDFNGETTKYVYDTAGRLKTLDYPQDADVTFGYDARGQRISAIDGRGESTSTFDAQGRIVRADDADGFAIEYTYDKAGNMLSRVSASQSLVYGYDARNRMVSVTRTIDGEAPSVTRYEYDQDGNRKAMIGGDGTRTEYSYDDRNRLRTLIKKTAAGMFMLGMTYTVDASGMRTSVEETDPNGITSSLTWQYDALKRLTREAIDHRDDANDRVSSWTYDTVGNRLTQSVTVGAAAAATTSTTTYTYDVNDRLLTETSNGSETRHSYDDNGNKLTKTTDSEVIEYKYNGANRLVEMRKGGERTNYVNNADGLRVRRTVTPSSGGATTTYFVQDTAYPHAEVIEEWTQTGSGAKTLTAAFNHADDLISQTRYANGMPSTNYVQADGLGSTRWLTNASGAITDSIDFDAFGVEIGRSGITDVAHLYRGEALDNKLGLYYLRARWLDPSNARFTQLDPFVGFARDPASLNKYVYTGSDPVNRVDPSGRAYDAISTSQAIAIAGTLATLAAVGVKMVIDGAIDGTRSSSNKTVGWLAVQHLSGDAAKAMTRSLTDRKRDEKVDLFRAVEDAEMLDIWECNCFRPGPSDFVKQFFAAKHMAEQIGHRFKQFYKIPSFHIVQATVSKTLYDALDHSAYEPGIGPIVTVQHSMLIPLNEEAAANGGIRYHGEY